LKDRKRFLLLDSADKDRVEKAILDYIGILGFGKAGVFWVKDNILSVNRKSVNDVSAGLLLADIKIKKVSGTLRGLNKRR